MTDRAPLYKRPDKSVSNLEKFLFAEVEIHLHTKTGRVEMRFRCGLTSIFAEVFSYLESCRGPLS